MSFKLEFAMSKASWVFLSSVSKDWNWLWKRINIIKKPNFWINILNITWTLASLSVIWVEILVISFEILMMLFELSWMLAKFCLIPWWFSNVSLLDGILNYDFVINLSHKVHKQKRTQNNNIWFKLYYFRKKEKLKEELYVQLR